MKNFVAIDFETANYEPTSICFVGLVVVRGGEITQRMHRLVCPEPDYYIRQCYIDTREKRKVFSTIRRYIGKK